MAPKKIAVELLQDMAHVGRKWEIVDISSSQARNFLIPKGMAKEITKERLKKIELDKKRAQDQMRERLEKAFDIQKEIDGQKIHFALKGKWKKIFGGLDEHAISKKVHEMFGVKFEKQDIKLPNKSHIKSVGDHLVYLHITHNTLAKIVVTVTLEEV